MRHTAVAVVLLCCLPVCVASSVMDTGEEAPIRILLTHGGNWFQEAEFFAMIDALEGVEYTRALLPEMADLLRPGLQQEYDVIVMYDMVAKFTPQQQQAFVALLNEGIGLVSLRTEYPRRNSHLAWTRSYGQSRVFYLMLGHDSQAWKHPAYPRLLHQGIRWAAGR